MLQTVHQHLVLQQIQVNFWHRDEGINGGIFKFALKRSQTLGTSTASSWQKMACSTPTKFNDLAVFFITFVAQSSFLDQKML